MTEKTYLHQLTSQESKGISRLLWLLRRHVVMIAGLDNPNNPQEAINKANADLAEIDYLRQILFAPTRCPGRDGFATHLAETVETFAEFEKSKGNLSNWQSAEQLHEQYVETARELFEYLGLEFEPPENNPRDVGFGGRFNYRNHLVEKSPNTGFWHVIPEGFDAWAKTFETAQDAIDQIDAHLHYNQD